LQAHDPSLPRLNVLLKADVGGSLEAIVDVLDSYTHDDQCVLDVVDFDVGAVTMADVHMAKEVDGVCVLRSS